MSHRILIIEDDADIAELIRLHLSDLYYQVSLSGDGYDALQLITQVREHDPFDLIILDLNLPGLDGIELCRRIRQFDELTPVLMLTSRATEVDRVIGLEVGADDYLTKPFSIRELQARVKAILRRQEVLKTQNAKQIEPIIQVKDLTIDTRKRLVKLRQELVETTAKEFDLLLYLVNRPGQVFSRRQLLDAIWGYDNSYYEHTVNSGINRLRAKLERNASNPDYILTVWGVGYKFCEG